MKKNCWLVVALCAVSGFATAQSIDIDINDGGISIGVDQEEPRENSDSGTVKSIKASVSGDRIVLADGREFHITKKVQQLPYPRVEMKAPEGAKVQLYYDQWLVLDSEIPFFYKDAEFDKYLKIVVTEEHVSWSFKFMPEKGYISVIDQAGGFVVEETASSALVSDTEFRQILAAIEAETFDDSRLKVMKSALRDRQVKVSQVAALIELFDFGREKVETGVFCYPKVVDKQNWYQVYAAFEFDNEKDALRRKVEE